MGNKIGINPGGALGSVGKRMKRQSSQAKELGLEDPYKETRKKVGKKKKKKGLRFLHLGKFKKYRQMMEAAE